jgi:hypothetical protein
MNALNGLLLKVFDLLLTPLELMGNEVSLLLLSGVFGVVALVVFKHISSQKGIKNAKDKIKGHMIAIRLYQDDLGVVAKSVAKVLLRNLQYVTLNFGPFLPLAPLFAVVVAQTVVRYGFEPLPVVAAEEAEGLMSGRGTMLSVSFAADRRAEAAGLTIEWPEGLRPVTPLVRNASDGVAFQEFVAVAPGEYDVLLQVDGAEPYTKRVVAGQRVRWLQPERVGDSLTAVLWPAEDMSPSSSPIEHVRFAYPESDLGWLPLSGPLGVMVWFVVASMVFAFAFIKPLGVQI